MSDETISEIDDRKAKALAIFWWLIHDRETDAFELLGKLLKVSGKQAAAARIFSLPDLAPTECADHPGSARSGNV